MTDWLDPAQVKAHMEMLERLHPTPDEPPRVRSVYYAMEQFVRALAADSLTVRDYEGWIVSIRMKHEVARIIVEALDE